MSNFADSIIKAESKEELDLIKHQLFMENVRLQAEKTQLQADYDDLHVEKKNIACEKKKLQREKKQLTLELNDLREQAAYERKRLKDDEVFYEKKMKLVERGFELLENDKINIQKEYTRLEREKDVLKRLTDKARKESYSSGVFFRGVTNQIALKKRYKDLLKIYHPDNICGDNEILLKINHEYEEIRKNLGYDSKAN